MYYARWVEQVHSDWGFYNANGMTKAICLLYGYVGRLGIIGIKIIAKAINNAESIMQ